MPALSHERSYPKPTTRNVDYYYPPKALAHHIPIVLVVAFVAAPVLYAMVNAASTPAVDSVDTMWDKHSRLPSKKPKQEDGYVQPTW